MTSQNKEMCIAERYGTDDLTKIYLSLKRLGYRYDDSNGCLMVPIEDRFDEETHLRCINKMLKPINEHSQSREYVAKITVERTHACISAKSYKRIVEGSFMDMLRCMDEAASVSLRLGSESKTPFRQDAQKRFPDQDAEVVLQGEAVIRPTPSTLFSLGFAGCTGTAIRSSDAVSLTHFSTPHISQIPPGALDRAIEVICYCEEDSEIDAYLHALKEHLHHNNPKCRFDILTYRRLGGTFGVNRDRVTLLEDNSS